MLPKRKKEQSPDIHNNMDETGRHYAEGKQVDTKNHILHETLARNQTYSVPIQNASAIWRGGDRRQEQERARWKFPGEAGWKRSIVKMVVV